MSKIKEDAPANATGSAVVGTGDDSSTVVVKKKKPLQDKLMKRMGIKEAIDRDRKSTRLNSSHGYISYAVFCLKKKKQNKELEVSNTN